MGIVQYFDGATCYDGVGSIIYIFLRDNVATMNGPDGHRLGNYGEYSSCQMLR